jgi:prepilin-type N-terminal cleavage/methylation domain-containing protein
MTRHSTRATPRRDGAQRGVTMVELLVTIIIAGIAFAALVPVFVYATKASAGDNARTVALGVAQDKIERIRSLPYDKVAIENLNDGAFATAHGLGNHSSATTSSGTKDFVIVYKVEYIYDPGTAYPKPGLELYKQVAVDVYWVGNPRPVKHTILMTDIYRQYAGPPVYSLQVSPRSQAENTLGMIVPAADDLVTITAYVETGVAVKEIRFTLTAGNGSYSKSFDQTAGTNGVYVWTWTTTDAPDGFYTITATAVSSSGGKGNTWAVVEQLETGAPPRPAGLTATPGDASVDLDWQIPAAGDIAYYEIWRSMSAPPTGAEGEPTAGATRIATGLQTIHYADTSLVNDTRYYYWVYAYDLVGNVSVSAAADATPSLAAGDHTAPTTPILTATAQTTSIALTWTLSQDVPPPDPPTGVAGYEIERSVDGVTFEPIKQITDPLNTSYTDSTVGSGSPAYWYRIRAVDASPNANRSGYSVAGPVQTPVIWRTLTVYNDRTQANKTCDVTVQDVVSLLYYNQNGVPFAAKPSGVPVTSQGGHASWQLPADKIYTVTATYTSGPQPRIISSAVPSSWIVRFQ